MFEHNANLLPWREVGARIVTVKIAQNGDFDYDHLKALLQEHKDYKLKIGAFSAGSNVTGTYFDVDRISILCH